jgi:integrase
VAERRVKGEGSIFQRKDGKWCAQVSFIGPNGKRQIITKVRRTAGAARKCLTSLKGEQDNSHQLVFTGNATLRAWCDVWLEEYIKPARAPKTYKSYHDLLEQHLPDRIGSIPLGKVPPELLQRHFNEIAGSGKGRTAEYLRAVLRSAFNRAKKSKRVQDNPVLATDAVQYTPQEASIFTAEEAKRLLAASTDHRLGALFLVALTLGVRKGEVSGLKPEDVDMEKRIIHIRRAIAWIKLPGEKEGQWMEREPKRGSRRDLPMTATIYSALIRHIARRQEEAATTKAWKDSGYLFTSVTGAPLHERNLSESFHALCDTAKVPKIRFHDVRHTAGTLLHVQGADALVIKEVLGHTQLRTTDRYTHIPLSMTQQAVNRLDALYTAAPEKAQAETAKPAAINGPQHIQ